MDVSDGAEAEFVHGTSRYIRIRTVGKGAFGTAVLYRKEPENQMVVLKRVRVAELSAAERARALAEARLLAALAHDHIVRYVGSWEAPAEGLLLLEMEYASGGTLAQMLAAARRPLTEGVVVNLFAQVVAAVRHVHALGVLHRDLKTENIFLTEDRVVKVGDFGIAKALGSQLQADTVLGTPHCLSPEMCSGLPYDHKSDVWALGCVLYELMCRRRAFVAASLPALVRLIVAGDVAPPPPSYSASLRSLLTALLRRDPTARPSAAVIEDAMLPPLLAVAADVAPPTPLTPPKPPSPRTVLYEVRGAATDGGSIVVTPVPLPPRTLVVQLDASSTHCIALTSGFCNFSPQVIDCHLPVTCGSTSGSWTPPFSLGHDVIYGWSLGQDLFWTLAWRESVLEHDRERFVDITVHDIVHGVARLRSLNTLRFVGRGEQLVFTWDVTIGSETRRQPLCVHSVTGLGVTSIAAGGGFNVFATDAGSVLTNGDGTGGRLGHGDEAHCARPKLVERLLSASIVAVAAGDSHALALSAEGHIFTWGCGSHGQLGSGYREDRWLPAVAPLPSGAIPLAVRAGPVASAVVCTDGHLLCSGNNAVGQLSGWRGRWNHGWRRGKQDRCWLRLTRVHGVEGVRDVRLGVACTVVLLDSGSLLVLGGVAEGRYLLHGDILMACAGDGYVAAVSRNQTLLVWGSWGDGISTPIDGERKEILALYASDEQIQRGATIGSSGVVALPSAVLLCVTTTAPVARLARKGPAEADNEGNESPVPEWLQEELALADEEWTGPL